jgi:N-acetylglucosaminyl-diphospho-decaprenol L-rhamnosyltransferase
MTAPRVRAVVVTWNGAHLLGPCLDSLLDQDLPPGTLEVVVVDNASTDGTAELVAGTYSEVRLVRNDRNKGFAGGVVDGLRDLDAPYAVLLNNDARFEPDAVRRLLDELEDPAHGGAGAATACILLERQGDGPAVLNSTGNMLSRWGSAHDRGFGDPATSADMEPEVFGFCGGAAMLRRTALVETGGFDPDLFLYYEDTDLSWRMRASGWTVRYVPAARAWHRHAASTGTTSSTFRYWNTRNSLVVGLRHLPWPVLLASTARQVLAFCAHGALALLGRGAPAAALARGRALRDAARCAPDALRVRRQVWRGRTARRRAIFRAALSRP